VRARMVDEPAESRWSSYQANGLHAGSGRYSTDAIRDALCYVNLSP